MSDDCGGDTGGCDSAGYNNDYSCDTQTSNYSLNKDYCSNTQVDNNESSSVQASNVYSGIGSAVSTLENAIGVGISNVEVIESASDNLNATTRLKIDDDSSIDNHKGKSETNITTDSIPSAGRYIRQINYLYESSIVSPINATSNINHKAIYNHPTIEISENSTQSTWFCIIMVTLATFLILLMIACVVLANMPTGSVNEKPTIYSPVMSRSLPQGAHHPISKI